MIIDDRGAQLIRTVLGDVAVQQRDMLMWTWSLTGISGTPYCWTLPMEGADQNNCTPPQALQVQADMRLLRIAAKELRWYASRLKEVLP